jgi:AraC-like DNA-binding protein
MALVGNPDEDRMMVGAHDEFMIIDTAEQRCVPGVQFKPGGAYPFLDMPADELQGEHLTIEGSLRERILEVVTPGGGCRAMEAALPEKARLELRPDIIAAIASLEHSAGLPESIRSFTQRFRRTVGLTPKTYARVRRFQSTLRRIAQPGDVDWADIALSCGYYDQAHFNHDFRAFSGINPSTYLAKQTPHLNHVPI